jgi:hypothetical protein
MADQDQDILSHLTDIKVDLAIVMTNTANIKETADKFMVETKRDVAKIEKRTSLLEGWRSWLAGAIAAVGTGLGLMAYFR